ncbi:glutamate receptor 2.2-like [Ipomoea triloba]|uniref:glutamate receptor 2.2-like n=1 Tax=Ipomoea triloba TaxID=35885 RepID=UPI00125D1672|nr:glutamate receptor 2.2-like [Ipomoea triloba]
MVSAYPNLLLVLVALVVLHSRLIRVSSAAGNEEMKPGTIGAIIDGRTRVGKEVKVAMEMAMDDFFNQTQQKLTLLVKNSHGEPVHAANAAQHLIKKRHVEAILGPQSWEETSTVAEVGSRHGIPVLSLSDSSPSWSTKRWPNLIQAAPSTANQMKAVADIVQSWGWWRVNVIYEDSDSFSAGITPHLLEALKEVDAQISNLVAIPSLADSSFLSGQLENLKNDQCRVFVVHASLPVSEVVFAKAKEMKMIQKGYVWITTDSTASLAHSLSVTATAAMQGVLGIQAYYPQTSEDFQNFYRRFQEKFRSKYPDERNYEPSFFAVRAYDLTRTLSFTFTLTTNFTTTKTLLQKIAETQWSGLGGRVQFQERISPPVDVFRIINVIGKSYNELGFWTEGQDRGFSEAIDVGAVYNKSMENALGQVFWPGSPKSAPRGWEFPTYLRIGVPNNSMTRTFVSIDCDPSKEKCKFSGFSVKVFELTMSLMKPKVPYKFIPFNNNYTELVENVHLKKFDAAVGDIAITAGRYELAEFSHSHTETGLVMVVANQPQSKRAWLFMKPFTMTMWALTFAINVYNGFVIWMIEKNYSSELKGSALNQIGSLLWLAFATLFSPHGELRSNLSKMATLVWLFVALILTQSYTASLASMLTVQKLEPKVADIETLKSSNAKVGCSRKAFVCSYLNTAIGFKPENIQRLPDMESAADALRNGKIEALFLEAPVSKLFLAKYCKSFTTAGPTYKIGGYGFAFPRGSPLLPYIDEALLKAFESSDFMGLENGLTASEKCVEDGQESDDNDDKASLSAGSFCVLFALTGGTSTTALLIYAFRRREPIRMVSMRESKRVGEVLSLLLLHMKNIKNSRRKVCDSETPRNNPPEIQVSDPEQKFRASI